MLLNVQIVTKRIRHIVVNLALLKMYQATTIQHNLITWAISNHRNRNVTISIFYYIKQGLYLQGQNAVLDKNKSDRVTASMS